MQIVQLTPGAAGMYCGSCMRDNALTVALRRAGHDALLVPLYTPLKTDEPDQSVDRIFFGGLNVYLQQQTSVFRKTPEWLDRTLDNAGLLRLAMNFGIKTKPGMLGELTLSMLRGEDGNQAKEIDKLLAWFDRQQSPPDVVVLSNALLAGMVRPLKKRLNTRVFVTLQGEDFFLDSLPEEHRAQAWPLLAERAAEADGFIAVSRYYGELMRARLNLPAEKVHAVHNGIELDGYTPAPQPPAIPTIGYLARMAPEKGLRTLVEAFLLLKQRPEHERTRLRIAGSFTPNEKEFVEALKALIHSAGHEASVDWLPNVDRAQKIAFLQSLSVFSVPASYGEAFGLFVLEALACGVPVVQPRSGAFPELLEATGGGILCEPNDAADLAGGLDGLLADPTRARGLGAAGRAVVTEKYGVDAVARRLAELYARPAAAAGGGGKES